MAAEDYNVDKDRLGVLECPFCGMRGFDKIGLKGHLRYDCDEYHNTENYQRLFSEPRE